MLHFPCPKYIYKKETTVDDFKARLRETVEQAVLERQSAAERQARAETNTILKNFLQKVREIIMTGSGEAIHVMGIYPQHVNLTVAMKPNNTSLKPDDLIGTAKLVYQTLREARLQPSTLIDPRPTAGYSGPFVFSQRTF